MIYKTSVLISVNLIQKVYYENDAREIFVDDKIHCDLTIMSFQIQIILQ